MYKRKHDFINNGNNNKSIEYEISSLSKNNHKISKKLIRSFGKSYTFEDSNFDVDRLSPPDSSSTASLPPLLLPSSEFSSSSTSSLSSSASTASTSSNDLRATNLKISTFVKSGIIIDELKTSLLAASSPTTIDNLTRENYFKEEELEDDEDQHNNLNTKITDQNNHNNTAKKRRYGKLTVSNSINSDSKKVSLNNAFELYKFNLERQKKKLCNNCYYEYPNCDCTIATTETDEVSDTATDSETTTAILNTSDNTNDILALSETTTNYDLNNLPKKFILEERCANDDLYQQVQRAIKNKLIDGETIDPKDKLRILGANNPWIVCSYSPFSRRFYDPVWEKIKKTEIDHFAKALDRIITEKWDEELIICIDGPSGTGKTTISRRLMNRRYIKVNEFCPGLTQLSDYNVQPFVSFEYLMSQIFKHNFLLNDLQQRTLFSEDQRKNSTLKEPGLIWDRTRYSNIIFYFVHYLMFCYRNSVLRTDDKQALALLISLSEQCGLVEILRYCEWLMPSPKTLIMVCNDINLISNAFYARGGISDVANSINYNYLSAQYIVYKFLFSKMLNYLVIDIADCIPDETQTQTTSMIDNKHYFISEMQTILIKYLNYKPKRKDKYDTSDNLTKNGSANEIADKDSNDPDDDSSLQYKISEDEINEIYYNTKYWEELLEKDDDDNNKTDDRIVSSDNLATEKTRSTIANKNNNTNTTPGSLSYWHDSMFRMPQRQLYEQLRQIDGTLMYNYSEK